MGSSHVLHALMTHHAPHILHRTLLLRLLLLMLLLCHHLILPLPLYLHLPDTGCLRKCLVLKLLSNIGWNVITPSELGRGVVQILRIDGFGDVLDLRIYLALLLLLLLLLGCMLLLHLLLHLVLLHLLHRKAVHVRVLAVHHLVAELALHAIGAGLVHPSHLLLHLRHLGRHLAHIVALHLLQLMGILVGEVLRRHHPVGLLLRMALLLRLLLLLLHQRMISHHLLHHLLLLRWRHLLSLLHLPVHALHALEVLHALHTLLLMLLLLLLLMLLRDHSAMLRHHLLGSHWILGHLSLQLRVVHHVLAHLRILCHHVRRRTSLGHAWCSLDVLAVDRRALGHVRCSVRHPRCVGRMALLTTPGGHVVAHRDRHRRILYDG